MQKKAQNSEQEILNFAIVYSLLCRLFAKESYQFVGMSSWEDKKVKKRNYIDRSHQVWAVAILVGVLLSAGPAFGQFIVQPMTVNVQTRPSKLVKTGIDIQSLDPNEVHTIDLHLVELGQWEDGTWRIIDPNVDLNDPNSPNFGFDISKLASCKEWITLRRNSVEITPWGSSPVPLDLRVPPGTNGFYAAGIIATLRARPDQTGQVTLIMRMLVPVIIEVQGRTMRHRVGLTDVGMELVEATEFGPATTLVSLDIENNGGTLSRLHPFARVFGFSDGHWRLLTTMEYNEVSIIPQGKLKLRQSIGQSLPTGEYKVTGALYVDAKRAKELKKEFSFVGDPGVTKVAGDAPIDLMPPDITITSLPGVTRSETITVFNASDEAINVQTTLGLPRVLEGVAFGDIFKGSDLDCSRWLKIIPEKFTLSSNGKQNLRIISEMSDSASMHPCYYALLSLHSSYVDGQRAGTKTANICIANEKIEAQPEAEDIHAMKLTPALMEGSRYLIIARFGNFGNIHFNPIECKAVPVSTTGASLEKIWLRSEKRGPMLPLEVRDFSGVLDVSTFPAGTYYLVAGLEYAPGVRKEKYIGIRISIQGGQRVVDIVRLEEELEEKITVNW